ncbi:MAG: two-component regulator propeller domain-containing protein [Bacteroidales bacterium]
MVSKYRNKYILLISVLVLIIGELLQAQVLPNGFVRMAGIEGLASDNIAGIFQDSFGFIWIGTPNGLVRYDGRNFIVHMPREEDSTSISDSDIRCIFEDSRRNLWIGTFRGGVCRYDPRTEKFTQIRPGRGPKHITDGYVTSITEDRAGRIWLGTYRAGINVYFPEKDSVFHLNGPVAKACGLATDSIRALYTDQNGSIWAGTFQAGLYRIKCDFPPLRMEELPRNISIKQWTIKVGVKTGPEKVYSISGDQDGSLLVCTDGMGAFRMYPEKGLLESFRIFPNPPAGVDLSRIKDVVPACGMGGYWVATYTNGIFYTNTKDKLRWYRHNATDPLSLVSDKISDLVCIGNELWIGTQGAGFSMYKPSALGFRTYVNNPFTINSLSSSLVTAITEDLKGRIWVGTEDGLLNVIDPVTHEVTRIPGLNLEGDPGFKILALQFDRDGYLWAGGYGNGLYRLKFNEAFGLVSKTRYKKSSDRYGISNDYVTSILETRKGEIWVTTVDGINRYDKSKGAFQIMRYDPSDTTGLSARAFMTQFEDREGNLWFGTMSSGVCILPAEQCTNVHPRFMRMNHIKDNKNSLSDNVITHITQSVDGSIWISTARGLDRYEPIQHKFIHYTSSNGLPSNIIYGVVEDGRGNIWISSGAGLSKLSLPGEVIRNFTLRDGLPGTDFNQSAAFKAKSGYVYYGMNNGLAGFNPDLILPDSTPPALALTSLRVSEIPVRIGEQTGDEVLLHESITTSRQIVLSYKQNILNFEWAVLDFGLPSQNRSAIMLEGYEDQWRMLGNAMRTTFTNLSPGKYILHIKGANSDGVWNEEGISLSVVIRPPFYATLFFRVFIFLLILAIIYSAHRYRVYRLNIRKKELETQVKERTLRLEKANQSLINQHIKIEDQAGELKTANEELVRYKDQLEDIIRERTAELLAAKLKAEESDRLKTSFLANMSHEIRTPMNAIIGFSGMLAEQDITEEEKQEFYAIIQSNSDYLLRLINDIIDLSMIHSGQLKISYSNTDIHALLTELYTSYQRLNPTLGRGNIQLRLHLDNDAWVFSSAEDLVPLPPLVCYTDPARLKQILINLVDNAYKYTERGYIDFGYRKAGQQDSSVYLEFFVRDTGVGISAEMQEKIFERFFKIEDPRSRKTRGTGLGLAITKSLSEHLGGSVSVRSEESKGSEFRVLLPLRVEEATGVQPKIKSQLTNENLQFLHNKIILVVEDEPSNYELLKEYLKRSGATIFHATNGEEAVEYHRKFAPDIILMDLKMEKMDGIEAMKKIRSGDTRVSIIAQTAQVFFEEVDKLKSEGFDEVLMKPIRKESLFEALMTGRGGER